MEFVKKLKSKSLKKAILPVCLLLVGVILFAAISEFWLLVGKPVNLYDVPRDALEGKYVTVEIPYIYGCYAYTEQYKNDKPTGVITSSEYIIDANVDDYCGLLLPKDMVEQGDALLDESDAYANYETDEITGTFTVKGVMKKMPGDSLDFYHEAVDYDSWDSADQARFLPLYLVARGDSDNVGSVVFLAIALALLVIAVVMLVKAVGGSNQKQLMQKAEELSPGNPDYILTHVEQLYEHAPSVGGLRMNASLILLEQGAKQFLYGAKDLVWAYQNTVQHRTNGIPTHKSYHLILRMADGTTRDVAMKGEQVKEQLQKIFALIPGCALGYSQELEAMYKSNRAGLAEVAASQHAPAEPAASAEAPAPQVSAEPQA